MERAHEWTRALSISVDMSKQVLFWFTEHIETFGGLCVDLLFFLLDSVGESIGVFDVICFHHTHLRSDHVFAKTDAKLLHLSAPFFGAEIYAKTGQGHPVWRDHESLG